MWDIIGSLHLSPICGCIDVDSQLTLDDTIARKVNESDASAFAQICGCCPSQGPPSLLTLCCCQNNPHISVWGVVWLIQALIFFALGVIVGLVAFKVKNVHVLLEIP